MLVRTFPKQCLLTPWGGLPSLVPLFNSSFYLGKSDSKQTQCIASDKSEIERFYKQKNGLNYHNVPITRGALILLFCLSVCPPRGDS